MTLASELVGQAQQLFALRLGLRFSEERLVGLDRTLVAEAGSAEPRLFGGWLSGLDSRPLSDPAWTRLIARLTIGETHFWRDDACFNALEHSVLPALIASRHSRRVLRVWSAACSTGEEPYSLAILLDRLLPDRLAWDVTLLATDLNKSALETARRGLYRPWALRAVPAAVRDGYFRERGERGFAVDPKIRRMVCFKTANLAERPPPPVVGGPMDLILCRNVLMYLTPEASRRVVAHLQESLAEDGWLIVAPAEASAEAFRPLRPVNFPGAIFFHAHGPEEAPKADEATPPRRREARALPPRTRAARSLPSYPRPQPIRAESAAALTARARALADRGSLDEARRVCKQALAADRLNAGAYRLMASIEQERGREAAALVALQRALYLDPDASEGHLAMGRLLLARGDRRKAVRYLETADRLRHAHGGES